MAKVIATKDLWNDEHDKLLVLRGTQGTLVSFEPAKNGLPASCIVKFADGQTTFVTTDEILEIY